MFHKLQDKHSKNKKYIDTKNSMKNLLDPWENTNARNSRNGAG